MIPRKKNSCIIFGGEPTVQVKGKGKGGRNQELVLQILKLIHNSNDYLASFLQFQQMVLMVIQHVLVP